MILENIRKRLKLFSILSSIIFLLPTRTSTHACSYSPETEELRYMLFNPDLLHNKSWWTFFYNAKLNYLDGQASSAEDEDILTRDWIQHLNVTVDVPEAWRCLFGGLSDSLLQQNVFFKKIQQQPEARKYFDLARRCEDMATIGSSWEEDAKTNEVLALDRKRVIDALLSSIKEERNPFFKEKYAFQLVKLAYYADEKRVFNAIYRQYFQDKEEGILRWWAMHYKSMMLERQLEVDSANYLHARVFSHSSNKMFVSRQFFSSMNLEALLRLAQNDEEKAEVYVLSEAINPGRSLEGLDKIYSLSPMHKHLPLLVVREINKLEDWLGSTKYANTSVATDPWGEKAIMGNWQEDYKYLSLVIESLKSMSALASHYPGFYNLSMTSLYLMKGDANQARAFLGRVESNDQEVDYQKRVFEVLLMVQEKDITKTDIQDQIGVMYESLLNDREKKFESQKILYSLSLYLRYAYANKGMIHLAGLFDNYAVNKFCFSCIASSFEYSQIRYFDEYASRQDVQKLIELCERPVRNKLEEVLLRPYSNINYLYDLLSVKYLREGDVKNAMLTLQKVPDEFWFSFSNAMENIDSDPFLNNSQLLDVPAMATYNKREIVEKMYALEQEAKTNQAVRAHNCFLLGNAWYNFSDNSWFMISYGWTMGETDNPVYGEYAQRKALSYYKMALESEENNEKKAKLLYMIAHLNDNEQREIEYARAYERYRGTNFYTKRNCLTLSELAQSD